MSEASKVDSTQYRLTLREAVPFPVEYIKRGDGSMCVVKQDDLEGLVKYSKKLARLLKIMWFCFALLAVSFVSVAVKRAYPESTVIVKTNQ